MTGNEQLQVDHSYSRSVQSTRPDVDGILCGADECFSTETDKPTPVATSSNTQAAHVSPGAAYASASTNTPRKVRYSCLLYTSPSPRDS